MPRLEQVLGVRLDQLDWDALVRLAASGAPEAVDLEYKESHYGTGDSDKREFAKDVAALANTNGGLLLIGIGESNGGLDLKPVSLSEPELIRYRQIAANQIFPLPSMNLEVVRQPDDSRRGVLALAIPRSPLAPHAVAVNEGLRYPRRHGPTTEFLSEPEVAAAYRARFALASDRQDLASEREGRFLGTLDPSAPWLVVTLVPDLPGHMIIDRSAFQGFQSRMNGRHPTLPGYELYYRRFRTGYRCLRADGGSARGGNSESAAVWCAMEEHSDGSGMYAIRLVDLNARYAPPDGAGVILIDDESLAAGVLAGLESLSQHAWNTGSGGMANVLARVWPVGPDRPTTLGHSREFGPSEFGPVITAEVATHSSHLLELLHPAGPDLVGAAAWILRDLTQGLGVAEVGQLDPEGTVRSRYWSRPLMDGLAGWCESRGIPMSDAILP